MFYVKFINESRLVDIMSLLLQPKLLVRIQSIFAVFNVSRFTREQVPWKNKHKITPLISIDFLLTSFSNIWVAALRVWLICKCDLSSLFMVSHLRCFFFFSQNRCEIISDKPDIWKGLSWHRKNSWPYWVLHLLGFKNCAVTSLTGKHLPFLLDRCTPHDFQMYCKWIKAWTKCWHSK